MFNEILMIVLENLQMVGMFLIPLAFMRFSDICLGANIAWKSKTATFDWKKFIISILQSLVVLVGIAAFITSIVILPEIMKMYNVEFINTDIATEVLNVTFLLAVITTSVVTYGKDCINKILVWFNLKKEDVIPTNRK